MERSTTLLGVRWRTSAAAAAAPSFPVPGGERYATSRLRPQARRPLLAFSFSVQVAVVAPTHPARAAYAQRSTTTLQRVFRDHFNSFAQQYESRYAKELGNFRIERISSVATRFIACGDYP